MRPLLGVLTVLVATLSFALVNDPCFVDSKPGVCLHTADCRRNGGTSTRHFCKEDSDADIQCCTKPACANGGSCQFDSQCLGGTSVSNFCPGPTDFRCCLDQRPGYFALYGVNEVCTYILATQHVTILWQLTEKGCSAEQSLGKPKSQAD